MSKNNFPKESSALIKQIRDLDFVSSAHTESMNGINKHNIESTISFNKKEKCYYANINFRGHSYKIHIDVQGNKPNPKYEKKIKKLF